MSLIPINIKFSEVYADEADFENRVWTGVQSVYKDNEMVDTNKVQYQLIKPENIYKIMLNFYHDRYIRYEPKQFDRYMVKEWINKLPMLYTRVSWIVSQDIGDTLINSKNWGGMTDTQHETTLKGNSSSATSTSPLTTDGSDIKLNVKDNISEKSGALNDSTSTSKGSVDATNYLNNISSASILYIQNVLEEFANSFDDLFVKHYSYDMSVNWGWS